MSGLHSPLSIICSSSACPSSGSPASSSNIYLEQIFQAVRYYGRLIVVFSLNNSLVKLNKLLLNVKFICCFISQEEEEFVGLCSCLGILRSGPQTSPEYASACCLDWSAPAFDLMSQWCSEVILFAEDHSDQGNVCKLSFFLWYYFQKNVFPFPLFFFVRKVSVFAYLAHWSSFC